MGILLVNYGEDLGNLVLFFWLHQNPFGLCSWDQDESFHWSTCWTDPPSSYCNHLYCHGWIPRWALHFLGARESPQPGTCGTYATPRTSAPHTHSRGLFCRRQATWQENKTHKFWNPISQTASCFSSCLLLSSVLLKAEGKWW